MVPELGLTGRPIREFPEPQPLTHHGPARIIAMCNQKGGVGKTTSAINLGACLAEAGRRVLLVDLDPQAALSAGLGVRPVVGKYDFIILDCLPSLGLLTVNALACAHGVIVPMECEYFASRGLNILIDTLKTVRDRVNFDLELVGILVTMFDRRTVHSREVIASVVAAYGEKVFDTVITRTVRFPETSYHHEPIITWASGSQGAVQYRQLAREVIGRLGG